MQLSLTCIRFDFRCQLDLNCLLGFRSVLVHISQTPLAVLFVSLRLTHFVPPNKAVDWTFKYQLLTEIIDTPAACKVTEL